MGLGRGLSCGESCMKYILFFFNIIFFLLGAAMLGIGLWLRFSDSMKSVADFASAGNPYAAVYFVIALGAFVFLVGFLGCVGACCESQCMLGAYAGIIILLVILEIAAAITAGVMKGKMEKGLQEQMESKMGAYDDNKEAVDLLQQSLKCCGVEGHGTYDDNSIPASCCVANEGTCEAASTFKQGCHPAFMDFIKKNIGIIIGVCVGVLFIQIIAAVFACCVLKGLKDAHHA